MLVCVVALTFYCTSLLQAAAAGRMVAIDEKVFVLVVGGFVAASAAVVGMQSVRISNRVSGPESRLLQALQRIRTGDVGFRITLRRGDLLVALADECNELLDWLNRNPPNGAHTGGDIVEVRAPLEKVGP
ncbi:MAG TPA: hypothetical protein VF384_16485 [Planctomycetota bacterium]